MKEDIKLYYGKRKLQSLLHPFWPSVSGESTDFMEVQDQIPQLPL